MKKRIHPSILTLAAIACSIGGANAATVFVNNDFEDGTSQDWSLTNSSAVYENGDVIFNMGAADASINYSPEGDFSLALSRQSGEIRTTSALQLSATGAEDVTIAFAYNFRNGSGTRRLYTDYSSDGGATWVSAGAFVTGSGTASYTLLDDNFTFTDNAFFRLRFSDSGGAAGPAFADNIVISSATAIPEPSAAFLAMLGGLALLRRRTR